MLPPSFVEEASFEALVGGLIAGVDEVGRGPWAGPVVASAMVILDKESFLESFSSVRDSKALSKGRREALEADLKVSSSLAWALGQADVEEIDRLNILQATFLAMKKALEALQKQVPSLKGFLVDGTGVPPSDLPGRALVKGDQKSWSVAAASILAKVSRDRQMAELAKLYPAYGWERNAGYGTRQHQEALERFGVTPYHRRSFAPVARLLG